MPVWATTRKSFQSTRSFVSSEVCLLGGKTGALELVGAEYCASKTAKEVVSLNHNVGDVLESANHPGSVA